MIIVDLQLALLLFSIITKSTNAAEILAVFPHTGKSHFFMFQPYVYKLAERGHHVTIINHFPDKKPPKNITYIDVLHSDQKIFFNSINLMDVTAVGPWLRSIGSLYELYRMAESACEYGLSHKNFQKLLSANKKFDLLIVEFFNTDCFASLAHFYKIPFIGIFSSVMMPWHYDRFGIPDNPSYVPNHFNSYGVEMGLFQRVYNTIATGTTKLLYRYWSDGLSNKLVKKYVGQDIPPVQSIVNNASLFLVNSHFTIFQPRPFTPSVVEVGGFHLERPNLNKIPKDILNYIDENSPNGFIYFSLGSTINGSTMSDERLDTFRQALDGIKENVLWKWESDKLPVQGERYLVRKWFPQYEILAHPKCKLFITHAGLMGTQEAVYNGVPMVMLPFFGDQPHNAALLAEKGIGVVADFATVSLEVLKTMINRVLTDKSFSANAKKLQEMFLDRPQNTMDAAIYWTEYVLKYNGASQLRSKAVDLAWYELYLLDVFSIIFFAFIVTNYLFYRLLSYIFSRKPQINKQKKAQ